jgi:site-specific DNA-methyltransferase (cytosine-N4-specific)
MAEVAELLWHRYRYYPYERVLGRREIKALLPNVELVESGKGVRLFGNFDPEAAKQLVYFAGAVSPVGHVDPTTQGLLERVNGNGVNRQSTRYSAHGLHEYKGKFNPQVPRAILNIFGVRPGSRVIDPFCGSGTSLLECVHSGMKAVGTDINPLAVFLANAKLDAIHIPVDAHRRALDATLKRRKTVKRPRATPEDARCAYLRSWFDVDIFDLIERLRISIEREGSKSAPPLLAIASNLLRDYSLQDPNDLRIRRRKDSIPEKPFHEAFEEAAIQFLSKLEDAQGILSRTPNGSRALLLDSRTLRPGLPGIGPARFDCAITSPPYATALPYIDTQRLSLVWLGLISPSEILPLEARLVGSREVRGQSKRELLGHLLNNDARIPAAQANYCRELQMALSERDGFRRQAVPLLLYRYFAGMARVFQALRPLMKKNAPFALVVGHNHTVLGGRRFDIDTPAHLASIALACGWAHDETIPLQTYQRYGYHMENAVSGEGLVIVRAA